MARAAEADRTLNLAQSEEMAKVHQFLHYKKIVEDATKRMKELQPGIVEWMKERDPDEDGSYEVELDAPVESFARLKLVRVVKVTTNESAVERIIKAKGLTQCLKVITIPDEDEIAQAALRGDLTDDEMSEMFPQEISHRLMTPKK